MTVDFKQEVAKRRDSMMKDLIDLLRIKSEREDDKADTSHPFGPGPVNALNHFLEMAERDGYTTKNIDNYAGQFEYGEGDEVLGIFAHLDVVPAGSDWETDPYNPVIKDGKLYARGSSDDKGPTMACYYGLKIIKDLALPVSKKVRFIVGTDEESGWGDMDYYFKHNDQKLPDFGFSPDAEFPIINGEKGNITEYLHFSGKNSGNLILHSFKGGLRENMVPESATAAISGNLTLIETKSAFDKYVAENPEISGTVTEENGKILISVVGKSAHGMSPQVGINGATYLARFIANFDFDGPAKAFLTLIDKVLHKDYYGEKVGIAYTDEKMGELTMNAGVFNFDEMSNDNTIALNMRYPQGTTPQKIKETLEKLSGVEKVTISEHGHVPHYVPMDDPLVATLLKVYEKHTGLKGEEKIIGGGTFGRLLKRGVAYGAMFPGYENTMHQANEFTDVEDLYRAAAIYAEAIYELIK
ncbi:dipeptidase PepV [Streptococcus marimammalium]|uniref:dipeptidase PepV n=1 Tax=Streptococcus marimammalium TaxID=269666 RepID=UPI00037D7288|nr:dipeptidase PepV [Streptococcus marimammalium]